MASKLWIFVLMAMVMVTNTMSFDESTWGISPLLINGDGDFPMIRACNGSVGDCIGDEDEQDSEFGRRQLARRRRYYV